MNPCVAARLSPLGLAIRLGMIGIAGSVVAPSAMATCSTVGTVVTCSGVPSLPLFLNNFPSATNGLTVNVNAGAQMNATSGGHVFDLTGNNITLTNGGLIDPAVLGRVSVLSGGAFIGNLAGSVVNITNSSSGTIRTGGDLGPNLTSLDGAQRRCEHGPGGTRCTVPIHIGRPVPSRSAPALRGA